MPDNPEDRRRSEESNAYALAFGLGAELLGALIVCGVPGWLLDRKLGTSPWWTLVGVLLGICLGLYQLVRTATQRPNGGAKRG